MKQYYSIINWLENNNKMAYSLIRIFLGLALFVRGVILSLDTATIIRLAGSEQYYWWYSYIIVIHMIGGLCLAIGFATRIAALAQIPILIGAVFIIHLKKDLASPEQSLEISVLVLVLLFVFFLFGAGALSIDNYIKKSKEKK